MEADLKSYRALAFDYDGTIAHDGLIAAATESALLAAKAAGFKIALVTGREFDSLLLSSTQSELFDLVVAENGALLYDPLSSKIEYLTEGSSENVFGELERRGIAFGRGHRIWNTSTALAEQALAMIAKLGLKLDVSYNKEWAMYLPPGVDKASGLLAGLKRLGLGADSIIGMGDGENDIALLEVCGFAVAPANAVAEVKAIADIVLLNSNGAGVVELIYNYLLVPETRRADGHAVPR